jgi:hypothetical protein
MRSADALLNDYIELRKLLDRCEGRLAELDKMGGQSDGPRDAAKMMVALVGEARQILVRLHTMRSSNEVINRMLQDPRLAFAR